MTTSSLTSDLKVGSKRPISGRSRCCNWQRYEKTVGVSGGQRGGFPQIANICGKCGRPADAKEAR